jgi:hypothetical protein
VRDSPGADAEVLIDDAMHISFDICTGTGLPPPICIGMGPLPPHLH